MAKKPLSVDHINKFLIYITVPQIYYNIIKGWMLKGMMKNTILNKMTFAMVTVAAFPELAISVFLHARQISY
ncbi:MAG TPA: hypothetical protein VEL70_01730 [Candidatus Acidoferrum sp.]|nr:hypothetical protein [Candidatus Acidoferrum sp.]